MHKRQFYTVSLGVILGLSIFTNKHVIHTYQLINHYKKHLYGQNILSLPSKAQILKDIKSHVQDLEINCKLSENDKKIVINYTSKNALLIFELIHRINKISAVTIEMFSVKKISNTAISGQIFLNIY